MVQSNTKQRGAMSVEVILLLLLIIVLITLIGGGTYFYWRSAPGAALSPDETIKKGGKFWKSVPNIKLSDSLTFEAGTYFQIWPKEDTPLNFAITDSRRPGGEIVSRSSAHVAIQ